MFRSPHQEVVTKDFVDKTHGKISDDRRIKVHEVAGAVGISTEWHLKGYSATIRVFFPRLP